MAISYSFSQGAPFLGRDLTGLNSAPQATQTSLIQVNVYPQWYKHIALDWTIPATWGNCTFHVYSAPGPGDEYQRLTETPLTSPMLTNTVSKTYSKFVNEYYVVEAFLPDGITSYASLPTTWSVQSRSKLVKISSDIQRREYMLLTKFAGVKSFFFRKRYYGVRCTRCWNPDLEKVMDDNCPVCVGTSWEGGYFNAVPVYLQYDPTPNDKIDAAQGQIEPNQINAWTISVPFITDGDVIIRTGDFDVYKVVKTTNTELQTNTVRQILTLTQLGRKDIENILIKRAIEDDAGNYLNPLGGDYSSQRFPRALITATRTDDPAWAQTQTLPTLPQKYSL